jgi:hypothetical protein
MDSGENLVQNLVRLFPQFETPYREHLKDNRGELLPHVVFWNFTQMVIESFADAGEDSLDWREVLRYLERSHAAGDAYLRGIIEVSFLENLPFPHEHGYGIVRELPPQLRTAFRKVRPDA